MSVRWAKFAAVVLMGALAVACGGSGAQFAGIDGGGFVAQGPITRFGSIFVNGVEYSIANASIVIGGQPGTSADLRVGQLVTVTGTQSPGTTPAAMRVDYEPTLTGPVQSVDVNADTLTVAGLLVRVTSSTSFATTLNGVDSLKAGDFVEISGYHDANGIVIASRIDTRTPGQIEVQGVVKNPNAALKTFTIGALTIDYSAVSSLRDFTGGAPAAGDFVQVEGMLSGATLNATQLSLLTDSLDSATSDHVELEGAVTAGTSPSSFDMGQHHVTTSASTQYQNGTAADLAVSRILEVEGSVGAGGTIVADRITFREDGGLQLSGAAQAVDPAAQTFELLGMTIKVNDLTRFDDRTSNTERFSLADIHAGDFLDVRAYQSGGATIATYVTREPTQSELDLRGVLQAPALPQFTLLGQTILTDSTTRFRNASGNDIDQATFFALAAVGSHDVGVKGTLLQGTSTVNASDVRLEN